ncbi:hypothetical protein [Chroococcidiopsis sp. CCNUC1]|uniref:hypothetical protein n=1 Tax=Chroococcidiopsis sp. CCNUC1 TaxID=2653189 RepID=UPI00202211DB|nr:hypothetical protein [Chroococcidiopsis sp. CCNUC1]URD53754.1 hypothetical protein M5J74_32180 [Chroococcidiopsis sp. CCNUC1]
MRYDADKQNILPQLPTALDISADDADISEGYLTLDDPGLWDSSDEERLPDSWFTETKRKGRVPKKDYTKFIPQQLQVLPNGKVTTSVLQGTTCWFIRKPFLVCLNCGVVHDGRKNEFSKLSRLSSEGRSTATTLLCLSTTSRLKQVFTGEKAKAAKILSFTDNRQDASLQAGHFNDFVQTSFLRAALLGALGAKGQLTHSELVSEVAKYMGLSQTDYAKQPAEFGVGKQRNEEAFRKLIQYRLYEDLRRGWRIVQPNLEQCGLLAIEYDGLEAECANEALWQKHCHPILLQATPKNVSSASLAFSTSCGGNWLLMPSFCNQTNKTNSKAIFFRQLKNLGCLTKTNRCIKQPGQARAAAVTKKPKSSSHPEVKLVDFCARPKLGRCGANP